MKDNSPQPVIVGEICSKYFCYIDIFYSFPGSKTEGALLMLLRSWRQVIQSPIAVTGSDRLFPFDSSKKRSTAIVQKENGTIRLYCKGASESVLRDCSMYLDSDGQVKPLTVSKRYSLEQMMRDMNLRARRTLCLTHRDFDSWTSLPDNWMETPPDDNGLVLDCVVALEDPIRSDVKEAVATAIRAGITLRMVTGDNLETACAIARQCGILTEDGISILGADFRKMKPMGYYYIFHNYSFNRSDVDRILPRLQVLARSSPNDKYLLVTRLNGHGIPKTKQEWEDRY